LEDLALSANRVAHPVKFSMGNADVFLAKLVYYANSFALQEFHNSGLPRSPWLKYSTKKARAFFKSANLRALPLSLRRD